MDQSDPEHVSFSMDLHFLIEDDFFPTQKLDLSIYEKQTPILRQVEIWTQILSPFAATHPQIHNSQFSNWCIHIHVHIFNKKLIHVINAYILEHIHLHTLTHSSNLKKKKWHTQKCPDDRPWHCPYTLYEHSIYVWVCFTVHVCMCACVHVCIWVDVFLKDNFHKSQPYQMYYEWEIDRWRERERVMKRAGKASRETLTSSI